MTEKQEFRHLFTPGKIKNVTIKNRIVFLPHWAGVSYYGMPTQYTADYYVERAKGGAGLIVLESMAVHLRGQMAPGFIKAYDRNIIPPMTDIARRMHECGAKVFSQLHHCGSTVDRRGPHITWAPSVFQEPGRPYVSKEIEKDEIKEVVEGYGISAAIQREANIDGVELKIGHDGLLRSFVSPYSNRRTDEYGGSLENRTRIIYEIVREIRRRVGDDYPVGARFSFDEFTPWGYSLDYGLEVAKRLEDAGFDYISTDVGTQGTLYMQVPPMVVPLGYAIYIVAAAKKALNIPVFAFGRINDPVMAESILADGNADFIGMCRQLICDPETPRKAEEGRVDDIRHCIACMDGCMFQTMQKLHAGCIQNPGAGREREYGIGTLTQAESPKKIMVIGGGVAGMKAAEISAKRGHFVSLYEKSNVLGGQVNLAEKLPHRAEVEEVPRYLRMQIEQNGVEINMNREVDLALVREVDPDIVIVATGAVPHIPEIPGSGETEINIITPNDALERPECIGNNVMVYDNNGHWKAAGMVEYAQLLGAKVHCATPFMQLGDDMEYGTREMLYQRVCENGIDLHVHSELKAVTKNGVVLKNVFDGPDVTVEGIDTLIMAVPAKSDNALYLSLKEERGNVYGVGDCLAPRLIEQVIFDSEELCRKL